jgi:hypothetical protein
MEIEFEMSSICRLACNGSFGTMQKSSARMSAFGSAPQGEVDVDREIRIEKMKHELDDLADGSTISGGFGEVSPELEEAFLTRICEFEKAAWDTNFNRLVQCGVEMIPPTDIDETSLCAKLHDVLRALAEVRCFLENTDHLSDRELYVWLWAAALREETPDLSQLGGAWHISPIGGCDEHDIAIFLKYYASEKERRQWQEEFPSDTLPPRCPLPYNRDRNLPRPESR